MTRDTYSDQWDAMHWGHAASTDLVHWEDLGIALAPGDPYDVDGCHSGTVVPTPDGVALFYTGFIRDESLIERPVAERFRQTQNVALSTDGLRFEKWPANPLLDRPPADGTHHWRDPKVWREVGSTGQAQWHLLVGNAAGHGVGRALVYRSEGLQHWTGPETLAEGDGTTGFMWECPDLFELDGRAVLLISPMFEAAPGVLEEGLAQCGVLVGELAGGHLQHGPYQRLDHGHSFYAGQTMQAPDGRRLVVGWMPPGPGENEQGDGWAGQLSVPRQLRLVAGRVVMDPVDELVALRGSVAFDGIVEAAGGDGTPVHVGPVAAAEVVIQELPVEEVPVDEVAGATDLRSPFGVRLRCGSRDVAVVVDRSAAQIVVDTGNGRAPAVAPWPAALDVMLRIFVDRSSIEVFGPAAGVTLSSRIYPTAGPELALIGAPGRAARVCVYPLATSPARGV